MGCSMNLNDLPIKFPCPEDVVAQDAARFRALVPEERVHTLDEMFRLYHFLAHVSGRSESIYRQAEIEEECGRTAIKEFVARHG